MDPRLRKHLETLSEPIPWVEGNTIPWDNPAFSARMLEEHLSQQHDAASRRTQTIDAHVAWIHESLLRGAPGSVLDLGCGPGLYCQRLAQLGHACTGIDFSPASIAHARAEAQRAGLGISYVFSDLRSAPFGSGHELAMLLFGEASVFHPDDLRDILRRAVAALSASGQLVLETHPFAAVEAMAAPPVHEFSSPGGLWSDRPHHGVRRAYWDSERCAITHRYLILDHQTGEITVSTGSYQAWTEPQLLELLREVGLQKIQCFPSLAGPGDAGQEDLVVYVATRETRTSTEARG